MTITLTIEELKAHDAAMNAWMAKRTEFAMKWLHSNSDGSMAFSGRQDFSRFMKSLEDYDSKNPVPRLIPAV